MRDRRRSYTSVRVCVAASATVGGSGGTGAIPERFWGSRAGSPRIESTQVGVTEGGGTGREWGSNGARGWRPQASRPGELVEKVGSPSDRVGTPLRLDGSVNHTAARE